MRKEKGVSKESFSKLHQTDQVLSDRAALSRGESCQCFSVLGGKPLLLPLKPHVGFNFSPVTSNLSSCQMIHLRPAALICTETFQFWTVSHCLPQRDSHSKWAAGITKTKPRHLPAPLRRCLGFPEYPPWHAWLRPTSIWRPQAAGCRMLPRWCLFLFDSLHLYKMAEAFLASHQALIWSGDFPVWFTFPLRTLLNRNCSGWLLALASGVHGAVFPQHLGRGCLPSCPFAHFHPIIWW